MRLKNCKHSRHHRQRQSVSSKPFGGWLRSSRFHCSRRSLAPLRPCPLNGSNNNWKSCEVRDNGSAIEVGKPLTDTNEHELEAVAGAPSGQWRPPQQKANEENQDFVW